MSKLPAEIRSMRWRDARAILDYWQSVPPVGEMLVVLAQVYTTWRPTTKPKTEEEVRAALMAEQERKWKTGQAVNAEQLFRAMGGAGPVALGADGVLHASPMIGGPWAFDQVKH